MTYPTEAHERVAHRAQIRAAQIELAKQAGERVGRSMVCAVRARCGPGNPHDTCVGAQHCLCECHDDTGRAT